MAVRAQEAREKKIASPEVIPQRVDDRLELQQQRLFQREDFVESSTCSDLAREQNQYCNV
jgi:hypothetical protein